MTNLLPLQRQGEAVAYGQHIQLNALVMVKGLIEPSYRHRIGVGFLGVSYSPTPQHIINGDQST